MSQIRNETDIVLTWYRDLLDLCPRELLHMGTVPYKVIYMIN